MKKAVILILFMTFLNFAQEFKVTIIVDSKINKNQKIYIAGNQDALGNWNPETMPLTKKNKVWEKVVTLKAPTTLEFKFTKGSWNLQALTNDGVVPENHSVFVDKDTTLYYKISKWNDNVDVKGKITGKVKYHKQLKGEGLLPRDVIVWLPPDYDKNKAKRYPVLYAHDGQNIFDPKTSSFNVDWGIDETADSLIKAGKMKEIIIVGVYNSSQRYQDYFYGDQGHKYADFLINNLKPLIDKNYRTLKDPQNTGLIGSSMGGLVSLWIAWENPDVFGSAICMSPAFKISLGKSVIDYTSTLLKDTTKKNIKIYIDNGGLNLESDLQPGIEETVNILKGKGYEENKDLLIFYDKQADHNERAWAKRVHLSLQFIFGL